jgi:hypothetical protein
MQSTLAVNNSITFEMSTLKINSILLLLFAGCFVITYPYEFIERDLIRVRVRDK